MNLYYDTSLIYIVGVESGALCEKSATHDDFSKLESLSENC